MIVVGGESLVDLIVRADELTAVPGGGPYNVARTIARLGRECAYLGALSTDRFGVRLRTGLRTDGVDDRWAPPTDEPTTLAVAQIGEDGAATYGFYVERTSAAALGVDQARAVLETDPTVLYVGTLGLVLQPAADSYADLVATVADDVLVAVDPNCRPAVVRDAATYRTRLDAVLARTDVVKVSTEDLDFLTAGVDHEVAARAIRDQGPALVLLTAGPDSVHLLGRGWDAVVPVPRVPVVDTVGAGDSFLGAFLSCWDARGWGRAELGDQDRVQHAVEFGIAVAGVTCGRVGADPPRAAELAPELAARLTG